MTPAIHWGMLAPEVVVVVTLALVFVADLLLPDRLRPWLTPLTLLGLVGAFVALVATGTDGVSVMSDGGYVVDSFARVAKGLFLATTIGALLLGVASRWKGEYLVLVLSSVLGMMLVVSARDLILFFVAFELFAIPGYLLTGWRKNSRLGHEGLLKYYLLGVLATAIMLYGISLLFGIAGGTSFSALNNAWQGDGSDVPLARLALLFVVAGLAFKVSAVPFHFWAPDAYQSAPIPVAAFLSVVVKAAGMLSILVVCVNALSSASDVWAPLVVFLSIVTMTAGNIVALRQSDLVRMLAYSSIAQAGYLLMPLAVATQYGGSELNAFRTTIEYLVIYAISNFVAFGAVLAIARRRGGTSYVDARGLFATSPLLAISFSMALFSLAGIPPFGGWFAKLIVFKSAIDAGSDVAIALAMVAALNTAIGLVYYAKVIHQLWMPRNEVELPVPALPASLVAALGVMTVAIVATGVLPGVVTQVGYWITIPR